MIIYVDYDGTLVNFIQSWLDYINKEENINMTTQNYKTEEFKEVSKKYFKIFNNEKYYENVENFENHREFLINLKQISENIELKILTSNISYRQEEGKQKHIEENDFGELINEVLHLTRGKTKTKKHEVSTDGHLIDDDIRHITEHCKNNEGLGILINLNNQFTYPEEQLNELRKLDNFRYVTSYNEIISLITKQQPKQEKQKQNNKTI
jgi:actin-related protein